MARIGPRRGDRCRRAPLFENVNHDAETRASSACRGNARDRVPCTPAAANCTEMPKKAYKSLRMDGGPGGSDGGIRLRRARIAEHRHFSAAIRH
jgi:hypothetical protein